MILNSGSLPRLAPIAPARRLHDSADPGHNLTKHSVYEVLAQRAEITQVFLSVGIVIL